MARLTINKITKIYCVADDFCKEFSKEIKKYQIHPDDGKGHQKSLICHVRCRDYHRHDLFSLRLFSQSETFLSVLCRRTFEERI
jgi:hypothetical protein